LTRFRSTVFSRRTMEKAAGAGAAARAGRFSRGACRSRAPARGPPLNRRTSIIAGRAQRREAGPKKPRGPLFSRPPLARFCFSGQTARRMKAPGPTSPCLGAVPFPGQEPCGCAFGTLFILDDESNARLTEPVLPGGGAPSTTICPIRRTCFVFIRCHPVFPQAEVIPEPPYAWDCPTAESF